MKNIKIIVIIFLLISIPVGLVLINQRQIFQPKASEDVTEAGTVRGSIVSFDRNTLVLRVNNEEKSLSLTNTAIFEWVSSGDYDQGSAQLTPVTINHLSPGFEVLAVVRENEVLKVTILKTGI